MKIRSITCFYNPNSPDTISSIDRLSKMTKTARSQFKKDGFEVQSIRLATVPFPYYLNYRDIPDSIKKVQELEDIAKKKGFSYISIGPALAEFPDSYAVIPTILASTENVFTSGVMVNRSLEISLPAVRACGKIIAEASHIDPNGFSNLRFASLANVPPYSPFFPAAYSSARETTFALAIECADLALNAFKNAVSLTDARQKLVCALEQQAEDLLPIASELSEQFNVEFKGLDFSLAPFPDEACSLGGAMERLGISQLGLNGSLAAAAFIADALDRGRWQRTGFNGLMMPVLEDSTLAQRSVDGTLTLKDLMLYSAVCGTGLDTVPFPGDASPDQLAAVLLDLASLAARLNKPLSARLMPIPGKKAGDPTSFTFDFFVNGCVMGLPAKPLHGLFAGNEIFSLAPRLK